MLNFEQHPNGTFDEIRLSRELARTIEQELPNMPLVVVQAYNKLYGQYIRQIQAEEL